MERITRINNNEDAVKLMNAALEHEWAVSFEYVVHAYSMPKGKYMYNDPIMKRQNYSNHARPGKKVGQGEHLSDS